MEVDDPFASITKLCVVSSSQEDQLRHCRFVGEPQMEKEKKESQGSGETTLECTGIMIMSPPESSEDNDHNDNNSSRDNDVFQTPPEGSLIASSEGIRNDGTVGIEEETAGGFTKGEKTVDLGADTDLGFSEVELTQRFDGVNEVIHHESNRVGVTNECLMVSLSKKLKTLGGNLDSKSPSQFLDADLGEIRDDLMKSSEKLNSYVIIPDSCGSKSKSPQSNQISEVSEGSSVKRKLNFSTEVLELETKATDRDLGFSGDLENYKRNGEGNSNSGEKNIDDIDKYRYVGPSTHNSCEIERRKGRMRALPVSICGQGKEPDSRKNYEEITLLEVLRMLAASSDCNSSVENKSILDVAKSRGMTFP